MAQRIIGRAVSGTVGTTTAAARLVDLIEAQLAIKVQDSCRTMTLQPSAAVMVGDASLGTTVGGIVQEGVLLAAAAVLTETADLNTVPVGSVFVQAVSATPTVNFQLIPY
jgi:hypothetical protein